MRFLKYLQENYIGIYKYAGMHTEIYENPSPNEIRFMPSIQKKEQHIDPEETIRFIAYAPTQQIFIWKSEGGIHDYVMDYLHSKRKIREAWNSSASGLFAGYAMPKGNKMFFTRGYQIFGGLLYEWGWLSKYFSNMNKIILYIRANSYIQPGDE